MTDFLTSYWGKQICWGVVTKTQLSEVDGETWWRFGTIWNKKRNTDFDFSPIICGRKLTSTWLEKQLGY